MMRWFVSRGNDYGIELLLKVCVFNYVHECVLVTPLLREILAVFETKLGECVI